MQRWSGSLAGADRARNRRHRRRRACEIMSRFTGAIAKVAAHSPNGLRFGTAAALQFASWAEIHQTAAKVAGRLAAEGVTRGSRVSVLAANAEDVAPLVQGI